MQAHPTNSPIGMIADYEQNEKNYHKSFIALGANDETGAVRSVYAALHRRDYRVVAVSIYPGVRSITELDAIADGIKRPPVAPIIHAFSE